MTEGRELFCFSGGLNFPVADGERTKHSLSWKEPMTVMTQGEQSAALMLIRDGAGYKRIASQLGLPVNTVKSFCRKVAAGATHTCPNCGKPVPQKPHRKEKRFCSDRCRVEWWNHHREQIRHKSAIKVICKHCGKEFESYGKCQRVYCSRECYDAARRK